MRYNVFTFFFVLVGLFKVTIGAPAGSSAGLHASSPPRSPARSPSPSRSSSNRTPAMQVARNEAKEQLNQSILTGAMATGGAMHAAYGVGRMAKGALTGKRSKMGDGAEMIINGGATAGCMGIVCAAQGAGAIRNFYRSRNPASAAKKYGQHNQNGQH